MVFHNFHIGLAVSGPHVTPVINTLYPIGAGVNILAGLQAGQGVGVVSRVLLPSTNEAHFRMGDQNNLT